MRLSATNPGVWELMMTTPILTMNPSPDAITRAAASPVMGTAPNRGSGSAVETVSVWGLPLARLTFEQSLDRIEELVRSGGPPILVPSNLTHAVLSVQTPSPPE